jgi:hypothetical protein
MAAVFPKTVLVDVDGKQSAIEFDKDRAVVTMEVHLPNRQAAKNMQSPPVSTIVPNGALD